ncbi:hypothetical protein [Rheinheimera pleomorphica]|uniref:hypothetical protein n=1 Tax=Rheinheimera pleomorphica TaxID=2703963 RepID=UPI001420FA46|nr:hypothetical protein [Rheinheimera pleomorphica]
MTKPYPHSVKEKPVKFIPNPQNYETSLQYEGMRLKQENKGKTIEQLRRKYAQ